jgi:hypothetical protein
MIAQTCDPALTALFTPAKPRLGHYEVCTTEQSIEAVAGDGWTIEALDPLDAFGSSGPYDRFAISRLYGGRRARVAHGWRDTGGQFESITLVSPYPDAEFKNLFSGTMIIRWTRQLSSTGGGAAPPPRSFADTSPRIHSPRLRVAAGASCRRHLTAISMFPVTTSIDITGSPSPIVVSPKRGPN